MALQTTRSREVAKELDPLFAIPANLVSVFFLVHVIIIRYVIIIVKN